MATGRPLIGADEVAAVVVAGLFAFEPGVALFGEEAGESVGDVGALGFVGWEEDEQVGVAAAEPGDEASGAEDDLGVGGAGEMRGGRFRCLRLQRAGRASEERSRRGWRGRWRRGGRIRFVVIGTALWDEWGGAQGAEEVDGGGEGELGGAEAGDEVAAADAAAFFEGFEDGVDGGEAAGDVFGGGALAEEDAVAVEELEGEGVGGFGGSWKGAGSGCGRPRSQKRDLGHPMINE